jgi:Helix-loop-helix DNA-binding domain
MKSTVNTKRFFKAQRERNRMHSLNKALDVLRKKLQQSLSSDLRLPKIEALKLGELVSTAIYFPSRENKGKYASKNSNAKIKTSLAKNYIKALEYLAKGNELTSEEFVAILSDNMRQSTSVVLRKISKEVNI